MNPKIKKILNFFTVNKYYLMSEEALQNEAAKWHIGGYIVPLGQISIIDRNIIIDELLTDGKKIRRQSSAGRGAFLYH